MLKLAILLATSLHWPPHVELDVTPRGAVVLIKTEDSLWIAGESVIDVVEPCRPQWRVEL